jgi:drug/metabolite transporter (DMT)-like permease
MLLSTVFFASMHACVRYLSADIHPFEIAFFRNLFGVFFLAPLILRNGRALLRTNHFNWHFIRASINVFAMLIFFYALSITPLATVQALSFTAPLFTTVLAVLLLGEQVRFRRWAAVIVGFIGVMIILRPGVQPIDFGALLVLLSASIWALTMIVIKRLSNTDSPLTITAYVTMLLTVMSFVPALFVWTWPVGMQWPLLLVAAVFGTMGQLCVAKAFAYADTTIVLPFDFAKIIWGAMLGYVFFGEYVNAYTWIGGIVIFAGATYVAYRERQLEKRKV